MSKRFDATLKDLGRESPRGFLNTFDQPTAAPLALLNVDLSTVTTAADFVIGVGDPLEAVLHFDFQAGPDTWKHADTLVYNSLLYREYHVPIHSIVMLLRPKAAHMNLNGVVSYSARPGRGNMKFEYEVVRLWERSALDLLAGELGVTPLAMLGRLPEGVPEAQALADVAQRIIERLEREAPPNQVRRLLTAAFVLTDMRMPGKAAQDVFRGVRAMRESATYMAIIEEGREEGREEEARRMILLQGEDRFGPADESVRTRLAGIAGLQRLEQLGVRLLRAADWRELLGEP